MTIKYTLKKRDGSEIATVEIGDKYKNSTESIKLGQAVLVAIEKKIDLYGADLSGADLYGADLSGADLSGADLYGAYLYGVNLSGAMYDNKTKFSESFDPVEHKMIKEKEVMGI